MAFRTFLFLFLSFTFLSLTAQNTTVVQAFNYESTTRDSLIQFPEGDHHQYEKIWMYYSMRCKDGLVSTTSDRNRGCGEWDYSCNTSIIDSARTDSLLNLHPNFVIPGWPQDFFEASLTPTYTYYEREHIATEVTNITNESILVTGTQEIASSDLFSDQRSGVYRFWVSQDELATLGKNFISGLRIAELSQAEDIDQLSIRLAATDENTFDQKTWSNSAPAEVFNDAVTAEALTKTLYFHTNYAFGPNDNLMVEILYRTAEKNAFSTQSASSSATYGSIYHPGPDAYNWFVQNRVDVANAAMPTITDEITIAMWTYGSETGLPANTSVLYGEDASGNRQVNIHLPWSNGQVYWDCGNNGSAYDRINKEAPPSAYRGGWNHWAFTKDRVSGRMAIYLNGEVFLSGLAKFNPIDIQRLVIGSNFSGGNPFIGGIDDVMVFDKELVGEEIKRLSVYRPSPADSYYENLVLFYDFNEADDKTLTDHSGHDRHGTFSAKPLLKEVATDALFKDLSVSPNRVNIELSSAVFTRTNTSEIFLDSVENLPYVIIPYEVDGDGVVALEERCVWESGDFPIYDMEGEIVDYVDVEADTVFIIEDLRYFTHRPSKFELLSFVTPYGINLDFGLEGKTWIFDVTDFGPILKGEKRLVMDRGGQWQEDIDIQFHFVEGTPTRPVHNIRPVWPIDAVGFNGIINNNRFEPRSVALGEETEEAKLRVAITGHGQEGEFIPRTHWINLDGGGYEFQWNVWKECAYNPVYPQGGTWVYDRAGWCPGAPTDLQEFYLTPHIGGRKSFDIDYGLNTATGDSRYIVNVQLVEYGPLSFETDAELEAILAPTTYVEFYRQNPVCKEPVVRIKNNGKTTLTSVRISYGVVGTSAFEYTWTGQLNALASTDVVLPSFPEGRWAQGDQFFAEITAVNGGVDDYVPNNRRESDYEQTAHLEGDVVVSMLTNGAPNETRWRLYDESGQVVASRTSGLTAFTRYTDTISNLDGCYVLKIEDSDHDGIAWWANGDGNGSIRIRSLSSSSWTNLQPDFGAELTYAFTTGVITSTKDAGSNGASVNLFPNPTSDVVFGEVTGLENTWIEVRDATGRLLDRNFFLFEKHFDECTIDLSDYSPGIYFVSFIGENGRLVYKVMRQ